MTHDWARRRLQEVADGQVGGLRRWLLLRHVGSCPTCGSAMDDLLAMRSALRTGLTYHRAPPALAARIGAALPREIVPPVPVLRWPAFAFGGSALAGAVAGVALTVAVIGTGPAMPVLETEAIASHVRSMMADHLTDVPTSDQHTVKPWLSARLDFSPVVKDLASQGFPLVGGRLDYLNGHQAAALIYRRDKHVINLFAFVSNGRPDTPPRLDTMDGFNVVLWREGGLTYVAVSDVEAPQLRAFADLVRGEKAPAFVGAPPRG